MAKAFSVQSYIRGQLEQDFKTFRDREKLGDAEAVRQLLTLALKIKLNDKEDAQPSNRELMEEMYRRLRMIQGTGNLTHTQSFDGVAFHEKKKMQSKCVIWFPLMWIKKWMLILQAKKKGSRSYPFFIALTLCRFLCLPNGSLSLID